MNDPFGGFNLTFFAMNNRVYSNQSRVKIRFVF